MSIASELGRLQQAKADLETSIEAKGVNVPVGTLLDAYPALVDTISGSSVLTGDAAIGEVLASKTFYSNDPASKLTGTMVNRGEVDTDITTVAQSVSIAAGYHNGSGTTQIQAAEQAKLIAANIASGVTVLGVAGSHAGAPVMDGNAGVGDVLATKTFYNTDPNTKETGTMTNRGAVSTDITAVAQAVTIAAGYHNGSGTTQIAAADQAKIITGNIKSGVTVLGVTGELSAENVIPEDWPDIHAIVAADVQAGYAYKYIYLMADDYTYSTFTASATHLAFKTSDGDFYTSTTTHNWDLAQDIATSIYKVRWVIVYSNTEALTVVLPYEVLWLDMYSAKGSASGYSGSRRLRAVDGTFQTGFTSALSMFYNCACLTRVPDILDVSGCATTASMFSGCVSLTRVPDILDVSGCTTTASMFYNCACLTRVPDILDVSGCETTAYMFNGCNSLTRVPDILDVSGCTTTAYMFYNCNCLTRVPDILDVSGCTTVESMLNYCNSLTRVPQITIATASDALVAPSFAQSTRVNSDYKSTVATFDGGGVVNGGMVYNLATVTITRALRLNSTIKALFTGAEQTAIVNNLTGKNWSLVW